MTNSRILVWTAMLLLTIGCTKSGNQAQSLASIASCGGVQKAAVDPSGLNIEGGASAKPGDPVQYTLSEDLSCVTNQEVTWKTVAGGTGQSSSSAFVATFKKTGEYVVTASVTDPSSSQPYQISTKTIVSADLAINGPQYGMAEQEHHFELAIPADVSLVAAQWNFGDGSTAVNGLGAQDHTYMLAGLYTVTVTVMASNGDSAVLTHVIQVLPATDGLECVRELSTSGPTQASVNQSITMSVYMPLCVSFRIGSVKWNFGDGTTSSNQTASHAYTAAGTYNVSVDLFSRTNTTTPMFTLTRTVTVTGGSSTPEDPTPENPSACSTVGQSRESTGDIYAEEVACGINGKKTMSYRDRITEVCQVVNDVKLWKETARVKELQSEGQCQSQACELPAEAMTGVDNVAMGILLINGKYYLSHGASKSFYSTQRPDGACSSVAQSRTCNNGVLSGSTSNVYLMCYNGCAGIGPHGTVVTGVVVGEASVPKVCAYGETGITDIFNMVADKTCENGEVIVSDQRQGGIKTAGVCPTYSWVGSDSYGACSADCGGTQSRLFECRDNTGNLAASERCTSAQPAESRVCDGNPEAVRRNDISTASEDASSSAVCPANQIGMISKTRTITTTKVYACLNHEVALESTSSVASDWVEERYCKDLVAHRCSQDSLSNEEANGRYKWLLKCRDQVPAIDEFLTAFEGYEKMTIYKTENLILNGRIVYPTFLYKSGKPWLAPKSDKGSCSVPDGVYIATVCLASCATPEQMILSQEVANGKLKYATFLEAMQNDFKFVASLASNSSMSSKRVQKTAVDQWVTELIDGNHDILEFTMKSGGSLQLTPNHPLVAADGSMKLAGDFKVGDSVVKLGGERDPIVGIRPFVHYGKVYNVFVKSNEIHKNIVVTNGYLNGTAFFQNEGAQNLNRVLLRGALIKGVLEK